MSEDTQLTTLENKIAKLFNKKTPKTAIKTRPGAGGLSFPYVDFSYVLKELDSNFGLFWEFKVTNQDISSKYVWVQGDLTIKSPTGFSISRPGTGGVKVKITKTTNEPVDIANDIKAATTNAIRKAASLYGIGADVVYKELGMYESSPDIQDEDADTQKYRKQKLVGKFFAVASERGFDGEKAKDLIKEAFNLKHLADISLEQLERALKGMEAKYQVVMPGEEPLKVGEVRKLKPVDSVLMDDGSVQEGEVMEDEEKVDIEEVDAKFPDAAIAGREIDDCGNPDCKRGEGSTKNKLTEADLSLDSPHHGFCSMECKLEYYPDLKEEKGSSFSRAVEDKTGIKQGGIRG